MENENRPVGWREGEPALGVVVARKGAGKTHLTKQVINNYTKGNPMTGSIGRRVLIIDCNDEYTGIPSLSVPDTKIWCDDGKVEVRRIRIYNDRGVRWSLDQIGDNAMTVLDNFHGGMIVMEDMTKYVNDSLPGDLIGTIATQRHQDTDMIIQFQLIQKLAHPKIWGLCNWVRMHRPEDTVSRHANKFDGNIDGLYLLESLVNYMVKSGNKYFNAFFDKDNLKVQGAFNKKHFAYAIDYFLENNPKVIDGEFRRVNLGNGERKYKDRKDAINALRNSYMNEYYGNAR